MKENTNKIRIIKKDTYKKMKVIKLNKQKKKLNTKRIYLKREKNHFLSILNKKYIVKYILIFISFLLILFLSYFIIIIKIYNRYNNKTIFFEEKFDNYTEAFNKAKDFINMNLQRILINTKKVKLSKKPKISVVIPCYNCKNYILSTIRSIQNQNFSNFEIVLVNDFPSNETILYCEQLQKEDERIRIINNKKNMGTLYSRSIGALSANGKYIFPVDSDDMLLDEKVFSNVINIADKNNLDITIFNSIATDLKPNISSTNLLINHYENHNKPNLVLFQPELGYHTISPNEDNPYELKYNEELMHAKCIKTKVYKKALNKLGEKRYSRFMLSGEDDLNIIIIFNTAKIAKYIPLYGYLYLIRRGSDSRIHRGETKVLETHFYILDAIIDFSQNFPRNKKVIINYIIKFFNNRFLSKALNENEYNNKLFISFFDRIFNCKYISEELKNEIRKRGKALNFINYNF